MEIFIQQISNYYCILALICCSSLLICYVFKMIMVDIFNIKINENNIVKLFNIMLSLISFTCGVIVTTILK